MNSRMLVAKGHLLAGITVLALGTISLPAGPVSARAGDQPAWDAGLEPVSIVTNGFVDVRSLLPSIADKLGLGLQMAPDVDGQVNVHMVQVPARQALDWIMDQAGLGYEVTAGVVVVHKQGMVTRWFTFDYPVTEREGRGELEISAGGGGQSSGSSGGSGGESQNKSHVTSTATMSIWPEIMESLKTLVFAGRFQASQSGGSQLATATNLADGQGRSLVVNPMAGIVEVTAEFDRVQRVESLLERVGESLQRQVAIQVKIMEVNLDQASKTGIDWETLTGTDVESSLHAVADGPEAGGDYFQFVLDSRKLTGTLKALEEYGDIKTLSKPRITTLNNQKAVVRVVRDDVYYEAQVAPAVVSNGVATEPVISYTPRHFSIGVILDVTPQVGADGMITLNVHPTISDVIGVAVSPNADQAPILSIRELDTVGKVQAGQTLVIAGLLSQRTQIKRSGIPLLKDIPVLGYLFGSTSTQKNDVELVMLLTPVILEGGGVDEIAQAVEAQVESQAEAGVDPGM